LMALPPPPPTPITVILGRISEIPFLAFDIAISFVRFRRGSTSYGAESSISVVAQQGRAGAKEQDEASLKLYPEPFLHSRFILNHPLSERGAPCR